MHLPNRMPFTVGLLASVIAATCLMSPIARIINAQREQFFDMVTQLIPAPRAIQIVVVDIDQSLTEGDARGGLTRSEVAELIGTVAQGRPAAIVTDIVFSAECTSQQNSDKALAQAISTIPVVLGFLLSNKDGGAPRPVPPVAVRQPISVPQTWFVSQTEVSCPIIQDSAHSAAGAFLIGDDDAHVRRVQAFSILGNSPYPTLGLEAARLALGASVPIIGGDPPWLRLGKSLIYLDSEGRLRFAASSLGSIAKRTVSATDVIAGKIPTTMFTKKLVFIGSSLPQLGGLRPTSSMPLEPSIQIHADIANGILTRFIPHRSSDMPVLEAAVVLLGGSFIAFATTYLRPILSVTASMLAILAIFVVSVLLYSMSALLLDGIGIGLSLLFVLAATAISQFAWIRNAEAAARRKFSQYLPRSVVDRYLDNQGDTRLDAEERPVTALFTDIEDFSALAQKLAPFDLVALLNIYFSEVNELVAAHGGMVDKVVGDAVHAFFNAPEDLEDHVNKAIDCAIAICNLTQEIRERSGFAEWDFGRTSVGVETGLAVLGEVGSGGKLDYTAHGDAINLAARLQEANKVLGTAICIGPEAAAQSHRVLRSLGVQQIRGFGSIELFTV